jgi:hypothetical protein
MQQRRDGGVEIIDNAAHLDQTGLAALLMRPRWGVTLIWYMRTLGALWFAKGVFNWLVMLGVGGHFGDFVMLPRALQISIGFFAAADLSASIGLWLAAPWGGALWLLTAAAEASTPLLGSRGSFITSWGVAINVVLIAGYVAISFLAGRERN